MLVEKETKGQLILPRPRSDNVLHLLIQYRAAGSVFLRHVYKCREVLRWRGFFGQLSPPSSTPPPSPFKSHDVRTWPTIFPQRNAAFLSFLFIV
jgi:hypothetical protein